MRNNRNRRKGEHSGGVESGKISSFTFLASCCPFHGGAIQGGTADAFADKRMRQVEETPKKGYYDPVRNGTL